MDTSQIELPSGRRARRRHPEDFKQGVIQACMQPGMSIAAIALAKGLNTNMVRKWVIEAQARQGKCDVRGGPPSLLWLPGWDRRGSRSTS
jgi:transposase-like protein